METHDGPERRHKTLQHCHSRWFETSENGLKCEIEFVRGGRHRVKTVIESYEGGGFTDKSTTDLAVEDQQLLTCKPHDIQRSAADPFKCINACVMGRL